MKIGIDIRCLTENTRSGVAEYTLNLLRNIFEMDKKNEYRLFYNSYKEPKNLPKFDYPNVKLYEFNFPNKLFNASIKILKAPDIDQLIKDVDLFFMPNISFISLSRKCKKIITVHDLSFERYPEFFSAKRKIWHKVVNPKKLISNCDKIIAISENTKNDLIELYKIEPEKIRTIYSGIGPEFKRIEHSNQEVQKIKNKYDLPEDFILYLGTLEPRKNIEGIIKAFEKFENGQTTRYELVIAGSPGWLYKDIYKAAKNSSVKDKIRFLNYIPSEEKPYLYNLASLFVYPSFYEGFGFPPLEAMACGTPVITSLYSSLPEIAANAGLLVDPYNINEIAKSMEKILKNETLKNNLISKGLEQAKKFNWQKTTQQTLEVFI